MNARTFFMLAFALSIALVASAAETHKLSPVKELPEGLSEKVAAELNPQGHRVTGPEGPLFDFWLAKGIDVKADFNPTLTVKYPFKVGQLIGAIRVPEKAEFTDFRDQQIEPGVYTLRYGQQPVDGNHIGTSPTSDFLLALPAKADTDPERIGFAMKLHEQSAKSVSSMHPAIFYLLASEKAPEKPALEHDESNDYWIVNVAASGKADGKEVSVPLRFVAVGQAVE